MAQLTSMSGAEAVRIFAKAGWMTVGRFGGHVLMSKPGVQVGLSIPQQKMLSALTMRVLVGHAGMTAEQFLFRELM
jgi:predicted RNA binding protein YcfA (HicA-like mRNA interferase family)